MQGMVRVNLINKISMHGGVVC